MGIERPDFSVDARGNARVERLAHIVETLDLPDLFNAAGRKGSRDSDVFIAELSALLKERIAAEQIDLTEDMLGPARGTLRREVEPILAREQVSWETFEAAVRRAVVE